MAEVLGRGSWQVRECADVSRLCFGVSGVCLLLLIFSSWNLLLDLENGLWAGNDAVNPGNTAIDADYVTAMVKGKSGGFFGLKGGDATKGVLRTLYDGVRPNGYTPMRKQGAIILGIGGDNSDWAIGTFFEGAMTKGVCSDETDEAVQANIVEAGYGA